MTPEDLASKILGLDTGIIYVSILNQEGTLLADETRDPRRAKYTPTSEAIKKHGLWVKLTFSIAQETDPIFGTTEYVEIAHKGFKHAAVQLPQHDGFAALTLERTADVEKIASLIQSTVTKSSYSTTKPVHEDSIHGHKIGTTH
jgi:hypothetical protein